MTKVRVDVDMGMGANADDEDKVVTKKTRKIDKTLMTMLTPLYAKL